MNENKITFEDIGLFAMIPHSFIKESKDLGFHTRWLYVALVYYRNTNSGVAFPSYDTIQELTGLRREMISKGIEALKTSGWIKKRRRYSGSTVYTVILNKEKERNLPKSKSRII
jgi:hypothetical protein